MPGGGWSGESGRWGGEGDVNVVRGEGGGEGTRNGWHDNGAQRWLLLREHVFVSCRGTREKLIIFGGRGSIQCHVHVYTMYIEYLLAVSCTLGDFKSRPV